MRAEFAWRQALLLVIARECFKNVHVFLEAIRPPVIAKLFACIFHMRRQPRQHGFQGSSFVEVFIGFALCFNEGLGQRLGNPAVGLINLAPDHNGVHDGKNFGLAIVSTLNVHIVFKQALHFAVTF